VLDPTDAGAAELARRIAAREWRAADVVDAYLAALHRVHATTNCIAAANDEQARADAATLDAAPAPVGPLHGVPVTIKDWIDVEGLPCTGGWTATAERMPRADATVVARLRAAGAVVLAKTTVQADSELFGRVHNPHDPTRSPGASSSGEAAAVGGGGSPLGLGSDSGGSIRLPAAWCGAIGYKPTAGRVPNTGHFPRIGDREDGRTVIGPLARRVEDVALALSVIAGADGLDTAAAPVPFALSQEGVDARSLVVSVTPGEAGCRAGAAIEDAVMTVGTALERAGARIAPPPQDHLDEAFDITVGYWERVRRTGADAQQQLERWDRFRYRMLRTTADVDVIVMPAVRDVAPPHRGEIAREEYVFTVPASLLGWPAIVLPVAWAGDLPVAVQLVAKSWDDARLLRVAALVEATLAWQRPAAQE
jgi:amidase